MGGTRITIYRKPTHTDQYLNFASNHHLQHKRSVVRSLTYRAQNLVTEDQDRNKELHHIKAVLKDNDYPGWALKPPKQRDLQPAEIRNKKGNSVVNVPLPYIQGVSERLSRVFKKHGVGVYHKPFNTIRTLLVHPKDPTPLEKKCGVVYEISCDNCPANYIGETARSLGTRVKEHLNTKKDNLSAVGEHCRDTGHSVSWDNISVLCREDSTQKRKIREAIEICAGGPTLNRDSGVDLAPIYKGLLSRDKFDRKSRDNKRVSQ